MRPNLHFKDISAISLIYLICCVFLLFALVRNHYQLIQHPLPLDYNEPIMLSTTALIAAGKNPYSFENQPSRTAVYPPLNNIIVAPMTLVFGNTLPLHRAVNGIFILASCMLCLLITYKDSRSTEYSLAAALIFYASLLYYSTPIAGPNGLGVFLFLATICIPYLFNFSNRSLAIAIILGVLAFYTKQYFVASLGFVALYLFIAISKKTALIFAFFSTLLFLTTLVFVVYTSPYYLDDTLGLHIVVGSFFGSYDHMLKQLVDYGQIHLPILGILVGSVAVNKYISVTANIERQQTGAQSNKIAFINLKHLHAPMLSRKPSYFWFCFLCSLVIVVFVLGKHRGNYLTYPFQLMSAFLLAGVFTIASRSAAPKWMNQLLILAAFYISYSILPRDFSIDQKNWDRLNQVVSEGDTVYASPLALGEIIENGIPIYYNGSAIYFSATQLQPAVLKNKDLEKSVDQIWKKYTDNIRSMVEHQDFDVILLDKHTRIPEYLFFRFEPGDGRALLEKHYQRTELIDLSLAKRRGAGMYRLEVWKPRLDPLPINETESIPKPTTGEK